MNSFTTPEQIKGYQFMVIKHAIKVYVNHGVKVNRAYTPTNMLLMAGKFTGKTYKRGQLKIALADMEAM